MNKIIAFMLIAVLVLSCNINQSEQESIIEINDGGMSLLPQTEGTKFIVRDIIDNITKGKISENVSWNEIETIIESAKAQTSRELEFVCVCSKWK